MVKNGRYASYSDQTIALDKGIYSLNTETYSYHNARDAFNCTLVFASSVVQCK